jgi:hypothetical protein
MALKFEDETLRQCFSILAPFCSPEERRSMARYVEQRINGKGSAMWAFRFDQLAHLFYPTDREKSRKLAEQMQVAADTGKLVTRIRPHQKAALPMELATWRDCPPIPDDSPLSFWLPYKKAPAPAGHTATPAPVVRESAFVTAEQRQAYRYQVCLDAGLKFSSNPFGRMPNGINKVAVSLGIKRQTLTKDLEKHIERLHKKSS